MCFFFNHKWGEIKDGYQRCEKCGIAKKVPCSHVFEDFRQIDCIDGYSFSTIPTSKVFLSKCKKCGEIKQTRVTS